MKKLIAVCLLLTVVVSTSIAKQWGSLNVEMGVGASKYSGDHVIQKYMGLTAIGRLRVERGVGKIRGGFGIGVVTGATHVMLNNRPSDPDAGLERNPGEVVYLTPQVFVNRYWDLGRTSELYLGTTLGYAISDQMLSLYSSHSGVLGELEVGWVKSFGRIFEVRISQSWTHMSVNDQRIEGGYRDESLSSYRLNAFTTRVGFGLKLLKGERRAGVRWQDD